MLALKSKRKVAAAVSTLVLGEVVTAREFLSTVVAFERFVAGVEGAVVTFEMFLTAEATVAQGADKRLGRVLGQRLLTSATCGGRWSCAGGIV